MKKGDLGERSNGMKEGYDSYLSPASFIPFSFSTKSFVRPKLPGIRS